MNTQWQDERKSGFLDGNSLKLLAAFFMFCDHLGLLLFPQKMFLRYLGRLAFPIFAFFIAEGCRYTRNRSKYLGMMALFGLVFNIVYYLFTNDRYVNVFVSFSLAICLVYLYDFIRCFVKEKKWIRSILSLLFLIVFVFCTYDVTTNLIHIDYGFFGILLPLLCYLTEKKYIRLALLALGIMLIAADMGEYCSIELWGLFAIVPLSLYNGKRGVAKMKNFFYVFYPAHLVFLEGASIAVSLF